MRGEVNEVGKSIEVVSTFAEEGCLFLFREVYVLFHLSHCCVWQNLPIVLFLFKLVVTISVARKYRTNTTYRCFFLSSNYPSLQKTPNNRVHVKLCAIFWAKFSMFCRDLLFLCKKKQNMYTKSLSSKESKIYVMILV